MRRNQLMQIVLVASALLFAVVRSIPANAVLDLARMTDERVPEAEQLLRDHPELVHATDKDTGCTALVDAAKLAHADTIRLLIDHGADIESRCQKGRTALMFAAICSLQYEVRHNICPEHLMYHETDSHAAAVQVLLQHGSNPNARCDKKRTAMHYAAGNGHDDILAMLVEAGGEVDAVDYTEWTPLFDAVTRRDVGAVRLLLEHGASVNATDDIGAGPLLHAAHYGGVEIITELLKYNPDPTPKDRIISKRAAEHARKNGYREAAELIEEHERSVGHSEL